MENSTELLTTIKPEEAITNLLGLESNLTNLLVNSTIETNPSEPEQFAALNKFCGSPFWVINYLKL